MRDQFEPAEAHNDKEPFGPFGRRRCWKVKTVWCADVVFHVVVLMKSNGHWGVLRWELRASGVWHSRLDCGEDLFQEKEKYRIRKEFALRRVSTRNVPPDISDDSLSLLLIQAKDRESALPVGDLCLFLSVMWTETCFIACLKLSQV